MKIMHTGIAAAMVISVFAQPTMASEATDKAALKRIYATMDAATKRGDMTKLGSYMTADFKMRMLSGQTMAKKQTLQATATAIKTMQIKTTPTKIVSMRVAGARATVQATGIATMSQVDPQGKAHKILILVGTRDHWIRTGNMWKERASEQTSQEVRMDGRVVSKQ